MKLRILSDLTNVFRSLYKDKVTLEPQNVEPPYIMTSLDKLKDVSIKPVYIEDINRSGNTFYYQVYDIQAGYVFSVDGINEELSDKFIYNLNTISPYRYFIRETSWELNRNLFICKKFIGGPAPSLYDINKQKSYINNILACTLNAIEISYGQLDTKHKTIMASVLTGAIARNVNIPLTPMYFADILNTNDTVAEAILQKYDPDTENFDGLPWIL